MTVYKHHGYLPDVFPCNMVLCVCVEPIKSLLCPPPLCSLSLWTVANPVLISNKVQVKLLFWRQIRCHCSQPNVVLHVTCLHLPQRRPSGGFWKRRNITNVPPFLSKKVYRGARERERETEREEKEREREREREKERERERSRCLIRTPPPRIWDVTVERLEPLWVINH